MLFFNFLFFSNNIRSFWYNIKVLLCFAALGTDFFQTHQTEKQSSAFEGHRYLDPLITMAMVAASFLLDCLLTITAVVGFLFNVYTLVSVLLTKQVILLHYVQLYNCQLYRPWQLDLENTHVKISYSYVFTFFY